ncbi:MAG: hypothetical protein ACI9Y1_001983 [Lentisphaeria bacterium]|jgi:hypothetical protein
MNILSRSMEQLALAMTIAILGLICLSFALSHQLDNAHEFRFLYSGLVLSLCCLYLRYGIRDIGPLHRAGYRIAVVMMLWAIGLYFFPYPNTVIYLVTIPGFYFLFRIEIKGDKAKREDIIAAGILFVFSVFLYIQQQPLQIILFETSDFNWDIYYHNAPCIFFVGLALIRMQHWVHWDGIATIGTLIAVISGSLSLSLISPQWVQLNELLFLSLLSHALFAFVFVPNPLFSVFIRLSGIDQQSLDFPKSIFWVLFFASQFSLILLLQPYWFEPIFAEVIYHHIGNFEASNSWVLPLILLNLTLPMYYYRQWSVSLVMLQTAFVTAVIVATSALTHILVQPSLVAVLFLAVLLATMVILKRQQASHHWIQSWGFVGVVACYFFVFFHTPIFTPLGLLGFIFPLVAWGLLPDRPMSSARRYEVYFWPLASALTVLCFSPEKNNGILNTWAILTMAPPLLLSVLLANTQLRDLVRVRGWNVLHLWRKGQSHYLAYYGLVTVVISAMSFLLNQHIYERSWVPVLESTIALLLCSAALLYSAIVTQTKRLIFFTELVLWLTMGLVRWKLENVNLLEVGSPIDGYIFLSIAIIVAGIREKMRDHSRHLAAYLVKSSIFYSLVGWGYLIYLHLSGAQSLHAELASLFMAGLFYWLARTSHKSLKVLVFVFANIALFLFFIDQEFDNALIYLTPALASALLLTQMFKDVLSDFQVKQIRLYCGLILLGVSAAYNVLEFRASVWYPVSAALMSCVIVVLGISFRIRIFLYLGTSFIFVNIVGMITNVIITQPPEKTMLAVALLFLCTGVLLVTSYLLFHMKREEIIQKYSNITQTIAEWE